MTVGTSIKAKIDELKKELGIKENEKVVITVSRLVEKNGISDLIEAMNILRDLSVKLLILGVGPLEENLKLKTKNLKNHSVWGNIGVMLVKGEAPKIADVISASSLFSDETSTIEKVEQVIDEALMIRMIEWNTRKKLLSTNEIKYLTEFAYGFSKLNALQKCQKQK